MKLNRINSVAIYAYILILSVSIILIYSVDTSFLYKSPTLVDSSIFYIVGKYWLQDGLIPYRDLWDMKGPLIYLVDGIGSLITNSIKGVSFVQIINLFITLLLGYKFLRFSFDTKGACALLLLGALALPVNLGSGNSVGEFMLPFVMLSVVGFWKWLEQISLKKEFKHVPSYAFVYGTVLGFSLLTRLTNGLGCCGAVALIAITLMLKKEWNNLYLNILCFVLGFVIVVIPFVLYFYVVGAGDDFWYGTILYNLEYLGSSGWHYSVVKWCLIYSNCILLFIISLVCLIYSDQRMDGLLWICATVPLLWWFYNGNGFEHYGVVCFPYIYVVFGEIKKLGSKFKFDYRYIMAGFILLVLLPFAWRTAKILQYKDGFTEKDYLYYSNVLENIPLEERSSFITYGDRAEMYYYMNIKPINPYFDMQDFESERGGSLASKIYKSFDEGQIKWILFCGNEKSVIWPILVKKYDIMHDCGQGLVLYHLKTAEI